MPCIFLRLLKNILFQTLFDKNMIFKDCIFSCVYSRSSGKFNTKLHDMYIRQLYIWHILAESIWTNLKFALSLQTARHGSFLTEFQMRAVAEMLNFQITGLHQFTQKPLHLHIPLAFFFFFLSATFGPCFSALTAQLSACKPEHSWDSPPCIHG